MAKEYTGHTRYCAGQKVRYRTGVGQGEGVIVGVPHLSRTGRMVYEVRMRTGNVRCFGEDHLDAVEM